MGRTSIRTVLWLVAVALVADFARAPAQALPTATRRGMVVAAHPLAARAGAEILASGGNAADALSAAAFALGVVEPHSSGLGGGGFALLYSARTGKVTALDFRETAPAATTPAIFHREGRYDPALSRRGGRAVGVPGAVAGYAEIARTHGTQPLDRIVAPAARLAEEGFTLSLAHHRALGWAAGVLEEFPGTARHFLADRDVIGQTLRQPALGGLLREIGAKGAEAFYRGESAEAIVRAAREAGGILTLDDLADYEVRPLTPLEGSYRGHRVVTIPPPSAGGVTVLATLAVLESRPPEPGYRSPEQLHLLIESFKRTFAARAEFIGDPRHEPEVVAHTKRILDPETIRSWVATIDPERATPAEEITRLASPPPEREHTSHLAAIDAAGNVALMTTTINGAFGSGVLVPEIGVLLNNELDDFAAPEGANLYGLVGGRYNAPAPGKTPVSSMAPTLVFRGTRPWIAVGAPGGSTIPTTIVQVITRVVDDGMEAQQAVAAPRLHAQHLPDQVMVEPFGLELATRRALERKGHRLADRASGWGNAMVILTEVDGMRFGSADPRGEGAAVAEDSIHHPLPAAAE